MVRPPTAALDAAVMLAVSCVKLVTVMKLTVIPEPKLTFVNASWKLVNVPLMTMLPVAPAWMVPGATVVNAGTPAVTLKPPVRVATSPPVVMVGL